MSAERTVTMAGNPLALSGSELKVGDKAPDFQLVGLDLKPKTLADFSGKVCIISCVPSIDTGVCDTETRRFNVLASELSDDVEILTVSVDLPFAQKRWCGAAGVDKVTMLSDHMQAAFAKSYGVLVTDLRILARCVFVVDKEGVVRYVQLVPEIAQEPDYDPIIAAAKELV